MQPLCLYFYATMDSSCCCGGCYLGRLDSGCKLGFLEGDGGDTSGQVAKWARNSSVYDRLKG